VWRTFFITGGDREQAVARVYNGRAVVTRTPRAREKEPTMSPKFETVLNEKKGPICSIVLNRPQKLNAINFEKQRTGSLGHAALGGVTEETFDHTFYRSIKGLLFTVQ